MRSTAIHSTSMRQRLHVQRLHVQRLHVRRQREKKQQTTTTNDTRTKCCLKHCTLSTSTAMCTALGLSYYDSELKTDKRLSTALLRCCILILRYDGMQGQLSSTALLVRHALARVAPPPPLFYSKHCDCFLAPRTIYSCTNYFCTNYSCTIYSSASVTRLNMRNNSVAVVPWTIKQTNKKSRPENPTHLLVGRKSKPPTKAGLTFWSGSPPLLQKRRENCRQIAAYCYLTVTVLYVRRTLRYEALALLRGK